ncbi:MAG TPA: EndoU domain-containing protein [Candidatus Dependentiae bacterium]|nr:EndoU domain-containing protein [Candidatus Dependentiae bacterium]HRQ62522.1 EndoU domain-containing protein [Candidatus Dependentiae bacterium]
MNCRLKKIKYLSVLLSILTLSFNTYSMKLSDNDLSDADYSYSISDNDLTDGELSDNNYSDQDYDYNNNFYGVHPDTMELLGPPDDPEYRDDFDFPDLYPVSYPVTIDRSDLQYNNLDNDTNNSVDSWHEYQRDQNIDTARERMDQAQQEPTSPQLQSQDDQRQAAPVRSSMPLANTIRAVNQNIQSDAYQQKLADLKTSLDEKISHAWHWQKNELEKQKDFIDNLLDGTVSNLLYTIQYGSQRKAGRALRTLHNLWPWGNHLQEPSQKEQEFSRAIGSNIMQKAEACFVMREDFLKYCGAWHAIKEATGDYRVMQKKGDMKGLRAEQKYLMKQVKKCDMRDEPLLRAQIVLVDTFLHAPETQILSTIAHEKPHVAKVELEHLEAQLYDHVTKEGFESLEAAREYLIEDLGFDVLGQAHALYESRPDCQELGENSRFIPIAVQQDIISALASEQSHEAVIEEIDDLKYRVLYNADNCQYYVPLAVETQLQNSIDTLKTTKDSRQIAFHIAVMDRLLGDIHEQTALQVNQEAALLERSPELLARALEKYITHLNPITQVKSICEFWVSTAHYVCDVTLGKIYLSPEQYQQRIDSFWNTIDALSPENLAQLTAEQWVDLAAQCAADITFGMGLGKTIKYLKNIDAVARTQRQAARIAQRFKDTIEKGLKRLEHGIPIGITPEGIPLKDTGQSLFQRVKNKFIDGAAEVVSLERTTLESIVTDILSSLEKELPALRSMFDNTKKGFAEFANKYIKIDYEHILGVDILFNSKGLPKLSGMHHDFMNTIEKSGAFKFVNKVMHKSGFYKADIWVNGVKFPDKTFFPATWTRSQVVEAIYEAYDNFVKSGTRAVLENNGKYLVHGITKDGVKLRMHITKKGLITSVYPVIK